MRFVSRMVMGTAMLLTLAPARARSQSETRETPLIVSITRAVKAHLDSAAAHWEPAAYGPRRVIIADSTYSASERRMLETAIMSATLGRRVTAADSTAIFVGVGRAVLVNDTVHVTVDQGWRTCHGGNEASVGTEYDFAFAGHDDSWHLVRSKPAIAYDAPPPPAPGAPPSGCPSFGLRREALSIDRARTLADTLEALERASWDARQRRDSAFFSRFLSIDHVEVTELGPLPRAAVLTGVAIPNCVMHSHALDHFVMTRLDDHTAVLTYRAQHDTRCNGAAQASPVIATSVYVYRDGRWQNAVHQEIPVPIVVTS